MRAASFVRARPRAAATLPLASARFLSAVTRKIPGYAQESQQRHCADHQVGQHRLSPHSMWRKACRIPFARRNISFQISPYANLAFSPLLPPADTCLPQPTLSHSTPRQDFPFKIDPFPLLNRLRYLAQRSLMAAIPSAEAKSPWLLRK